MSMEAQNVEAGAAVGRVLTDLFGRGAEVTEAIVRAGARVGYLERGTLKSAAIDAELTDAEIEAYQASRLVARAGEAALGRVSAALNSKGHYNYSLKEGGSTFRVNWSFGQGGHWMRVRRVPDRMLTPDEIGVPAALREAVAGYRQGGLVLLSAPTGHGKSTTVASLVQDLVSKGTLNVVTLEDPVEYCYKEGSSFVEQREVGIDCDSFESGAEACMRQTPDIVVIQELTTPAIAREAVRLMKKGAMVVATSHAPDVGEALDSLVSCFPEPERPSAKADLRFLLRAAASQRLVRRADGKGLAAAFEVLASCGEIAGYLTEGGVLRNVHQVMEREPHLLFDEDFARKTRAGVFAPEEALAACPKSRLASLRSKIQ